MIANLSVGDQQANAYLPIAHRICSLIPAAITSRSAVVASWMQRIQSSQGIYSPYDTLPEGVRATSCPGHNISFDDHLTAVIEELANTDIVTPAGVQIGQATMIGLDPWNLSLDKSKADYYGLGHPQPCSSGYCIHPCFYSLSTFWYGAIAEPVPRQHNRPDTKLWHLSRCRMFLRDIASLEHLTPSILANRIYWDRRVGFDAPGGY